MIKLGEMVLKGVNRVHNGYTMIKLGHKSIGSNGWVKWS